MRNKPWGVTEGILICCGWGFAGMLLQLTAGPVRWDTMAWPTNFIVLAILLLGIAAMTLCRNVYLFRWMATMKAGIPAILACAMMTMLLGVTRQAPDGHGPVEPIGITAMLSFWPFVLTYAWLVVLLGMVCASRLRHPTWRNVPFLLNHLGIFIALVAGTLGNADMQRLHMTVREGTTEWRGVDALRRVHPLPVAIELHDFAIEGTQERPVYLSDVTVYTKSGIVQRDTIRVNKPLSVRGWKIYQLSYDEEQGAMSEISVFELVRDPWLPYVYLGIFMMLAGALSLFFGRKTQGCKADRHGMPDLPATANEQTTTTKASKE